MKPRTEYFNYIMASIFEEQRANGVRVNNENETLSDPLIDHRDMVFREMYSLMNRMTDD